MAFGSFSSLFIALCSSSDVYIRSAFICLAYGQTAFKKSNTNVPRCVIVRTLPTNIPNPLLFSFKKPKLTGPDKSVLPPYSTQEGNTIFSGPLSNQSACAMT